MFLVLKHTEKTVLELEDLEVAERKGPAVAPLATAPKQEIPTEEPQESATTRLLKVLDAASSAGSSAGSSRSSIAMSPDDMSPDEERMAQEKVKNRKKSRLGTTKYLEPKKEISPEDRLIVFKEGSISIQAPGQLKIRGLNNKSISDGTYATLQDGNLHIYESLSTSPPLLSIPISNAFVSLEESLQRLKLTLVEDKDVYYLKGNTDTQSQTTSESEAELEDWYCCLLEMSLRWGSVQKTDLEYEVAATRKKVGELWELQGEKNIKVQKMIANLTAEIEAKDSLLADMVSAQEELNIQVMHARMQKRQRLETLFPDVDANCDTELGICVNIDDYDDLQAVNKTNVMNESEKLMEKLGQAKIDQEQEEYVPPPTSDTSTHQKSPNRSSMDTFRSFFPLIDMRRVSAVLSSTVTSAALPVSPITDLAIQEEITAEPVESINPSLSSSSILTPSSTTTTKKESEFLDQIKTLHLQQAQHKQELAKMTREKSAAVIDVQELTLRLGLAKTLNAKQAGDLNQCLDELQDVKSENNRLKQENIVLVARLEKELVEEGNLHSLALLNLDEKVQEKEGLLRDAEAQISKLQEQLSEFMARLVVYEQEKSHPAPFSNETLIAETALLKSQLSAKESQFACLLEDYSRQSTQLAFAQSRITDLVSASTSLASDLQTLHNDKRFNILHIHEQHDKDISLFKEQVSLLSAQLSLCTARLDTLTLDYTTQSTKLTESKAQIKDLLTTLQDLVRKDQKSQDIASILQADLHATRRERDILQEMGAASLPPPPSRSTRPQDEIKSDNASLSSSTEETIVGRDNEEDKQLARHHTFH